LPPRSRTRFNADLLAFLRADAVVEVSTGPPLRGIRNFAGPDVFSLDELGRLTLAVQHDNRTVVTDDNAGVFAGITGDVLTAGPDAASRTRRVWKAPAGTCTVATPAGDWQSGSMIWAHVTHQLAA
jgi:hypothetical protein